MEVNPAKEKKLTNIRTVQADEKVMKFQKATITYGTGTYMSLYLMHANKFICDRSFSRLPVSLILRKLSVMWLRMSCWRSRQWRYGSARRSWIQLSVRCLPRRQPAETRNDEIYHCLRHTSNLE